MKKRDEELVNYTKMIKYEDFLNSLKKKFPNNCLVDKEDCPIRKRIQESNIEYIKLDNNTEELSIYNPDTGLLETLPYDKKNKGYGILYKADKQFNTPYSEEIIYPTEMDKYLITKSDCKEFNLNKYTHTIDNSNNIITLTHCNEYGNIYIPSTYVYGTNNETYSIQISYNTDSINEKKVYTTNKYSYQKNPFFEYGISITNIIIDNDVVINCNGIKNNISFLFSFLPNLIYTKLPIGIEKANFSFCWNPSLRAINIDKLPYEANYMFYGCQFLEDISYIEYPDDNSKERKQILGLCSSIKSSDNIFSFKDEYNNPLYLDEIIYANNEMINNTIEEFNLPNINNINSYKNLLTNMPYLQKVSGTISKYATDITNLFYNTPNVSGFINVDCIWFDELYFEKTNAFKTVIDPNNREFRDPLVLIPTQSNKEVISNYIDSLPTNCNVYIQDNLNEFDYEVEDNSIILKRYNGNIKRLYIPDMYNGLEVVLYSGRINNTTGELDKGIFSDNDNITHIAIGDNVKFVDNSLEALFYNCTNLIQGIDLAYSGIKSDYMYYKCTSLDCPLYIDNSIEENLSFNETFTNSNILFITSTKKFSEFEIDSNCRTLEDFTDIKDIDFYNDKVILKNNTISLNGSKILFIANKVWYQGKRYGICFDNPEVDLTNRTATGFFQKLYTNETGFKYFSFNLNTNIIDLINIEYNKSTYIMEFNNDYMDYMFYNCTDVYIPTDYISQNITSAKYTFANTGKLFTRFNFGILDVSNCCSVDYDSNDEYPNITCKNLDAGVYLPNSIKNMEYFACNIKASAINKIVIPYMVENLNYSYFTNDALKTSMIKYTGFDDGYHFSKLPLFRLVIANYLFGTISANSKPVLLPELNIASNQLFTKNPNEYIIPNSRPDNVINKYLPDFGYSIINRFYVTYDNSVFDEDGNYKYTEIIVDEDKINAYQIDVLVKQDDVYKDITGTIMWLENVIRIVIGISLYDEIVIIAKTINNRYKYLTTVSEYWNRLVFNDDYEFINVKIYRTLESIKDGSYYLTHNIFNGGVKNTNEDGYIDLYNNIDYSTYIPLVDNAYNVGTTLKKVSNYLKLKENEYTNLLDSIYMFHLDNNRVYKLKSLEVDNFPCKLVIKDVIYNAMDDGVTYEEKGILHEITLNNSEDLTNPITDNKGNELYFLGPKTIRVETTNIDGTTGGPDIHNVVMLKDANYYPYIPSNDSVDFYIKTKFNIKSSDWEFVENDNRYKCTVELLGSSDIPQYEFNINSEYEESDLIDTVIPKNNFVVIYTKGNKKPENDILIELELLLGDESSIINPLPPTFDDNTGLINNDWICPFKIPYLYCGAHSYNIYRAYWFSKYYWNKGIKEVLEAIPDNNIFEYLYTITSKVELFKPTINSYNFIFDMSIYANINYTDTNGTEHEVKNYNIKIIHKDNNNSENSLLSSIPYLSIDHKKDENKDYLYYLNLDLNLKFPITKEIYKDFCNNELSKGNTVSSIDNESSYISKIIFKIPENLITTYKDINIIDSNDIFNISFNENENIRYILTGVESVLWQEDKLLLELYLNSYLYNNLFLWKEDTDKVYDYTELFNIQNKITWKIKDDAVITEGDE